ncbi:hypothetical protein V1511DRAFT_496845 [Dipodascopsis uninucleata]
MPSSLYLCSSPPFSPSNLRVVSSSSPPSSPLKGASIRLANQMKRENHLKGVLSVSGPLGDGHSESSDDLRDDFSNGMDRSRTDSSNIFRQRRQRDHAAILQKKRQAMFLAARGGEEEMMRIICLADRKKWEREMLQEDLDMDELLALEQESTRLEIGDNQDMDEEILEQLEEEEREELHRAACLAIAADDETSKKSPEGIVTNFQDEMDRMDMS